MVRKEREIENFTKVELSGGAVKMGGNNWPLRGTKGTLFEENDTTFLMTIKPLITPTIRSVISCQTAGRDPRSGFPPLASPEAVRCEEHQPDARGQ